MVLLITGATHAGKTVLAQKLMEKYSYPYLSIDHLKMGLIRSGQTLLEPESPDSELSAYLWPIVREIIKTAIENGQNLIVEGCYIPFDWQKDFAAQYMRQIRYLCLVLAESYIRGHWQAIRAHANAIERRLNDGQITRETLISENRAYLAGCIGQGLNYILIKDEYPEYLGIEAFEGS